jgi:hypothetical protein
MYKKVWVYLKLRATIMCLFLCASGPSRPARIANPPYLTSEASVVLCPPPPVLPDMSRHACLLSIGSRSRRRFATCSHRPVDCLVDSMYRLSGCGGRNGCCRWRLDRLRGSHGSVRRRRLCDVLLGRGYCGCTARVLSWCARLWHRGRSCGGVGSITCRSVARTGTGLRPVPARHTARTSGCWRHVDRRIRCCPAGLRCAGTTARGAILGTLRCSGKRGDAGWEWYSVGAGKNCRSL